MSISSLSFSFSLFFSLSPSLSLSDPTEVSIAPSENWGALGQVNTAPWWGLAPTCSPAHSCL